MLSLFSTLSSSLQRSPSNKVETGTRPPTPFDGYCGRVHPDASALFALRIHKEVYSSWFLKEAQFWRSSEGIERECVFLEFTDKTGIHSAFLSTERTFRFPIRYYKGCLKEYMEREHDGDIIFCGNWANASVRNRTRLATLTFTGPPEPPSAAAITYLICAISHFKDTDGVFAYPSHWYSKVTWDLLKLLFGGHEEFPVDESNGWWPSAPRPMMNTSSVDVSGIKTMFEREWTRASITAQQVQDRFDNRIARSKQLKLELDAVTAQRRTLNDAYRALKDVFKATNDAFEAGRTSKADLDAQAESLNQMYEAREARFEELDIVAKEIEEEWDRVIEELGEAKAALEEISKPKLPWTQESGLVAQKTTKDIAGGVQ